MKPIQSKSSLLLALIGSAIALLTACSQHIAPEASPRDADTSHKTDTLAVLHSDSLPPGFLIDTIHYHAATAFAAGVLFSNDQIHASDTVKGALVTRRFVSQSVTDTASTNMGRRLYFETRYPNQDPMTHQSSDIYVQRTENLITSIEGGEGYSSEHVSGPYHSSESRSSSWVLKNIPFVVLPNGTLYGHVRLGGKSLDEVAQIVGGMSWSQSSVQQHYESSSEGSAGKPVYVDTGAYVEVWIKR